MWAVGVLGSAQSALPPHSPTALCTSYTQLPPSTWPQLQVPKKVAWPTAVLGGIQVAASCVMMWVTWAIGLERRLAQQGLFGPFPARAAVGR